MKDKFTAINNFEKCSKFFSISSLQHINLANAIPFLSQKPGRNPVTSNNTTNNNKS